MNIIVRLAAKRGMASLQGRKESLLFLKKKKQKDSANKNVNPGGGNEPNGQKFFGSFF
ncbi:MAG: hypothetical protein ACRYGC_08720 [Janthinobacterium lividum]